MGKLLNETLQGPQLAGIVRFNSVGKSTCRKEDPLSGWRVSPSKNDLSQDANALFLIKLYSVASIGLVTLDGTLDSSDHLHCGQGFKPFRPQVVETVVISFREENQASNEQKSQK